MAESKRLCRKFLQSLEKGLSLDTLMRRAQRIVGMRIGHWLKIAACGSCEPPRCHPVSLTPTERIEAFHRAGQLLDKPVIWLNHVVEIFDLQDLDQPKPSML